jgi:hypothetical protein
LAEESEVNPMDGLANLADVMLVFVCGLMLALLIKWNIDIGGAVSANEEVTELEGLTEQDPAAFADPAQYEEMGVVYKDPATGKLYMVTRGEGAEP